MSQRREVRERVARWAAVRHAAARGEQREIVESLEDGGPGLVKHAHHRGGFLPRRLREFLDNLIRLMRVEASRGLVGEDDAAGAAVDAVVVGVDDDGVASRVAEAQGLGGDGESAALAAGDAADRLAAGVAAHEGVRARDEAEAFDDAVDVRGVAAVQTRVEVKCLADGEVAEESGVLLDVREGHVGVAVERPTAVRHLALDGRALTAYATGEDVQQSRLAAAARTEDAEQATALGATAGAPKDFASLLALPDGVSQRVPRERVLARGVERIRGPRRPRTRRRGGHRDGGEARTGARCDYLSDDRTRMFNGFVQRGGQKNIMRTKVDNAPGRPRSYGRHARLRTSDRVARHGPDIRFRRHLRRVSLLSGAVAACHRLGGVAFGRREFARRG